MLLPRETAAEHAFYLLPGGLVGLARVLAGKGPGSFEGVGSVVAIGSERIGRHHAVVSLALEIVTLEVLDEIIEAAVVVLTRLLLASLSQHITTIKRLTY